MTSKQFKIFYKVSVITLAIAAAALLGSIILWAIDAEVLRTFAVIFIEPLKSMYIITEVLIRTIPLIFVALGISVAFRSGIINIGAEGQMLMGILGATIIAVTFPSLPKGIMIPLALLAGTLFGVLYGAIPALLKTRLNVSELLSTVMLNYIAIQIYVFCIRGPLIDPEELVTGSGTPQSMRFPKAAWLSRLIPGTRLHTGLIIALVLAVLLYLLLWRTSFGYKMRAAGAGKKSARYGGINVARYLITAMCISGGFAGLAGSVEVMGLHRRAIEGISSGYGFTGIVVALFGGLHPAGIIPSAFLFGLILVGGDMTQRMVGVPSNMVQVLQGIIILAIVSAQMVINNPYIMEKAESHFRSRFPSRDKSEANSPEPICEGALS
ncbi:MAG: ABC transporter permease [Spirochaetales bacterium]|nr:ABC transporter permease [Spirochaetales bacterium]